jgi:5-methylcytosine-specific restriction enzyme B
MIDLNLLKKYSIEFDQKYALSDKSNSEKVAFLERFPIDKLKDLSLEEYVLGNPEKNGFCYHLEQKTASVANIWGGSSKKFAIWSNSNNWPDKFKIMDGNVSKIIGLSEAKLFFEKIKKDIFKIAELAKNNEILEIDKIKTNLDPIIISKIVFLYSKLDNEPITSVMAKKDLFNFCKLFNVEISERKIFLANVQLLKTIKGIEIFKNWNPQKIGSFLFYYFREKDVNYWAIAPFPSNTNHWEIFYKNNEMRIGWDETGDLNKFSSKEELHEKISDKYDNNNPENWTKSCWNFSHDVNIGDYIVAKMGGSKKICGIGEVTSKYEFVQNYSNAKHKIGVDWIINFGKDGKEFSELNKNFVISTVEKLSEKKSELIRNLINNKEAVSNKKKFIVSKNIILYGPPGTGKTFSTKFEAIKIIEGDFNR